MVRGGSQSPVFAHTRKLRLSARQCAVIIPPVPNTRRRQFESMAYLPVSRSESGASCAAIRLRPVAMTPCLSVKETVLKSVSRLIILSCVLILAAFALTGCQSGPKHEYPITIEDAQKQEATNPEVAYD